MTAQIELTDVHKKFGKKVVLDGVNLAINKGDSLVIIGGSGSGKSVTIKTILGLVKPDKGSIKVDGQEVIGMDFRSREPMLKRCGMLFQGGALFDSLTVWQNITFAARQREKMTNGQARDMAVEKLAAVGLKPEVADLMPAELSGGMSKRVGLARAIAANPEIIFFDEPTTGLDPIMSGVINELISAQVKKLGCTAITITHDMSSVRAIASRVAMIYQGKIIWDGNVADIDNSGNPYVDQFVHGRSQGPIAIEGRQVA